MTLLIAFGVLTSSLISHLLSGDLSKASAALPVYASLSKSNMSSVRTETGRPEKVVQVATPKNRTNSLSQNRGQKIEKVAAVAPKNRTKSLSRKRGPKPRPKGIAQTRAKPALNVTLFDRPGYPRPPLKRLVKNDYKGILGDVSWLLDFAIVGHSKTSTTTQMNWLANHEEIAMYSWELHALSEGRPAKLVRELYELPRGSHLKRGYKSPHELQRTKIVQFYQRYWPRTKLIVGLRHPVLWFQSYYNFNYAAGNRLPPAETMIGENFPQAVMFHEHLARLGKTNLTNPDEYQLLGRTEPDYDAPYMPNPVFLYEVSQPFDKNETRKNAYCQDMTDFLGLRRRLDPLKADPKAGKNYHKLNICEPQYKELRKELMNMGRNASTWLSSFFLKLPDVHVSSPQHFQDLIASWARDPCDET